MVIGKVLIHFARNQTARDEPWTMIEQTTTKVVIGHTSTSSGNCWTCVELCMSEFLIDKAAKIAPPPIGPK